jgi:hypothetical protein
VNELLFEHFAQFMAVLLPETKPQNGDISSDVPYLCWSNYGGQTYIYNYTDFFLLEYCHESCVVSRRDRIYTYYNLIQCEEYISNEIQNPLSLTQRSDRTSLLTMFYEMMKHLKWDRVELSKETPYFATWALGDIRLEFQHPWQHQTITIDIEWADRIHSTEIIYSKGSFERFEERLKRLTSVYLNKTLL